MMLKPLMTDEIPQPRVAAMGGDVPLVPRSSISMRPFSADEYAARRAALCDALGDDGVAILAAPSLARRSHTTYYRYRASSDVLYLCGLRQPESLLVFAPGHDEGDFLLFLPPVDQQRARWEGPGVELHQAMTLFGADMAYPLDEAFDRVPMVLRGRTHLHYARDDEALSRRIEGWLEAMRRRGSGRDVPETIHEVADVLHSMRMIKSAAEVAQIKRACAISARAHTLAMRAARPEMHEYALQAIIEYHFTASGAEAPAYPTIVASGPRANILHYAANRHRIASGSLVLIDAGCELDGYASDITRTFPIDGAFTPAQRDVYQVVLETQRAIIDAARPGVTHVELQSLAVRRLTQALIDFGVLEGSVDACIEEQAFRPYYPHSFGHWMGIDVHDVGPYYDPIAKPRALHEGYVITVEPGLYLPADDEAVPEALRGIGVRIEDDLWITEAGPEILTSGAPKAIKEIEEVVGSGGEVLQRPE